MKTLILNFVIALTVFSNASATETNSAPSIKFPEFNEETITLPERITGNESKDINYIIAQDNQIIESQAGAEPVLPASPIEYTIEQDNKIIESGDIKTVYPLDFKKINQKLPVLKITNVKA